jgi:hypothetical protein
VDNLERLNGATPQQDADGHDGSHAIANDGYDKLHISIITRRAKQHTCGNGK